MKLHDALILEFIKPDPYGIPTGKIIQMVGDAQINIECETTELKQERARRSIETIVDYVTPDLTVRRKRVSEGQEPVVAIELETDEAYDFAESMRQIKRYRKITPDVRIIIPYNYRDFATLYYKEGFPVWLWNGKRRYECLRCKNITDIEGPYEIKCEHCKKYLKHRLLGVVDVNFIDYTSTI